MGFIKGDVFHPNSLLFNFIPIMWPWKVFWMCKKVSWLFIMLKLMFRWLVRRDYTSPGFPNSTRGTSRWVKTKKVLPFLYASLSRENKQENTDWWILIEVKTKSSLKRRTEFSSRHLFGSCRAENVSVRKWDDHREMKISNCHSLLFNF